ncbi:hypothetical protein BLOT_009059 [Blomia tropicalis]|nr:hypothetical protein BLOT_009059 [Blomia tropicalis]
MFTLIFKLNEEKSHRCKYEPILNMNMTNDIKVIYDAAAIHPFTIDTLRTINVKGVEHFVVEFLLYHIEPKS